MQKSTAQNNLRTLPSSEQQASLKTNAQPQFSTSTKLK